MNMPYEMFLTIQVVHLTCMKYCVQSPARKKGWELFRRKSDDSSRFTPISIHEDEPEASIEKEKASEEYKWRIVWQDFKRPQTHSSYVTLFSDIIDAEPSIYE